MIGKRLISLSGKEINDDLLKNLLAMSNVLITPHQGFATAEALNNIAQTTFDNIRCWAKDQHCENELASASTFANSYIEDEEL